MQDPTTERGVCVMATLTPAAFSSWIKSLLDEPTALTKGVYVVSLQQSAPSSYAYDLTIKYSGKCCTFVAEDYLWHLTNNDPYKVNAQAISDTLTAEGYVVESYSLKNNSKELKLTFKEPIDTTCVQRFIYTSFTM